ncbi:inositol monophosphatase family protein [Ilumatobacter coccineus]|jgi:myo-inositol-1(or 4)-monophosphatase|uniref:Inositol-1-monophosphatase n=1 Tax=Ilumatobacter coccineus (strain NBRC 103263 / KCTC 29153 / YM16-304) TaxID=1313172 RepID=A0A6C7E5N1_ILUCY|nr:inositol monophosphatase family protein [Ilumatobacter coccineus]BAN00609.1 inositol-1-monophosphatase [Ilumatobacter coccineus YM16-304]
MPSSVVPPSATEGDHLVVVAVEVARLAATLVRASVGAAASTRTKSSPTDVVTATDVESEALIRRELLERCPGSTIVGEELDDDRGRNGVGWIVDPIDGTVNFLYDLPVVSVSIAATVGGVTVAGAVVDIVRDETFSAALGRGARRDGVPVRARDTVALDQALIGTGFSYSSERRAQQSEILNRLLPVSRDIRCMGSAALNLCWVGCGRLDGYYEHDTKLYDHAAGDLIASEGGARVDDPASNGEGLSIAASAAIFDELRAVVDG